MILSTDTVFSIEHTEAFCIISIGNGWYLDWVRKGNEAHWVRLTDNVALASRYENECEALEKIKQVRALIIDSTYGFEEIELNLQKSNHIIAHTRNTDTH